MSKETTATLVSSAAAPARAPAWLRGAGIVLAGSAFAAVCAHVSLPLFFTPVPLSLAPFAVLVLGLMLSPRMAAATFAAYLAEGAAGLPVFSPSPASGGLAHLFGPTGRISARLSAGRGAHLVPLPPGKTGTREPGICFGLRVGGDRRLFDFDLRRALARCLYSHRGDAGNRARRASVPGRRCAQDCRCRSRSVRRCPSAPPRGLTASKLSGLLSRFDPERNFASVSSPFDSDRPPPMACSKSPSRTVPTPMTPSCFMAWPPTRSACPAIALPTRSATSKP